MTHISEDQLLKYALELLDDKADITEIETHLKECDECLLKYKKINTEIDIIGGLEIDKDIPMPVRASNRKSKSFSLFRIAAILVIGFALGYTSAKFFQKESSTVTASRLEASIPPDSLLGQPVSDATTVNSE